jgi:hypothetical protein
MSQPEEKSKFDRSGKARTNERKYPYIVELSVPLAGLDIELSRQITTFHKIITAGASRIYHSLALSSNSLGESYAKAAADSSLLFHAGVIERREHRIDLLTHGRVWIDVI